MAAFFNDTHMKINRELRIYKNCYKISKMPKKRNLNGLPNSLEQRYFSTLFWWEKAYMADWIWNAANEKEVTDIEIDILHDTVFPKELEIRPIIAQLNRLRETMKKVLNNNGFPTDFIVDAKFKIYISQKYKAMQLLTCQAVLIDKEGIFIQRRHTPKKHVNHLLRFFDLLLMKESKD
jgi:hypothetical protein